jgi:hypothetical protein
MIYITGDTYERLILQHEHMVENQLIREER